MMYQMICDRCGRDINENEEFGKVLIKIYDNPACQDTPKELAFGRLDEHYCRGCVDKVVNLLSGMPLGAAVKEEEASEQGVFVNSAAEAEAERIAREVEKEFGDVQKEEKRGRRTKIDYGKIKALKDAGWAVADIAAEMRMEPHSVSTALYKIKKGVVEL